MTFFIQSKSGDHNETYTFVESHNLKDIMKELRANGGYYSIYRGWRIFVPFEEIEYIKDHDHVA